MPELPLPEFTRALRALGSRRSGPGPDHDRFFAPLLGALRAARETTDSVARLNALDGARLVADFHATLRTLAAEQFPRSGPDRRALEAELDDAIAPLIAALEKMRAAAAPIAGALGGDAPLEAVASLWDAWVDAGMAVFASADRAWLAMWPVLARTARANRRRPWWRRLARVPAR